MFAAYLFAPPNAGDEARARQRPARVQDAAASTVSSTGTPEHEKTLLDRVRAGDAHALRELFERCYARLLRFAMRYVRDEDVARDILQDVFATLWIRRESIAPRGPVIGYLYGAVRNESLRWREHHGVTERWRAEELARSHDTTQAASNTGLDAVELDEMSAAIAHAITALPPRTREVFLLSRDEGLSHRAIAEALGTSTQTVANQITRALQLLNDALRDWR